MREICDPIERFVDDRFEIRTKWMTQNFRRRSKLNVRISSVIDKGDLRMSKEKYQT